MTSTQLTNAIALYAHRHDYPVRTVRDTPALLDAAKAEWAGPPDGELTPAERYEVTRPRVAYRLPDGAEVLITFDHDETPPLELSYEITTPGQPRRIVTAIRVGGAK